MRICTKPKVYLIARSALNASGVEDFLREQSLDWPTEEIHPNDVSRGFASSNRAVGTDVPMPAEQLTELAGRCCYMSFGKKAGSKTNRAYLDNLIYGGPQSDGTVDDIIDRLEQEAKQVGGEEVVLRDLIPALRKKLAEQRRAAHGSVLEHATFSFLVVGAGRGFSHEQVRHRAGWAYSQLSTRYCDFERDEADEGTWDPGFTVPPLAQLSRAAMNLVEEMHQGSLSDYKTILARIEHDLQSNPGFMKELERLPEKERRRTLRKAARGAARDVLPNGTEAIMVMSANARAIWNTIALRATEHAEAEIRDIYVQIARIMEGEMPNVFRGLRFKRLWDGSEAVELPRDKI